jgi:hypothetical protein
MFQLKCNGGLYPTSATFPLGSLQALHDLLCNFRNKNQRIKAFRVSDGSSHVALTTPYHTCCVALRVSAINCKNVEAQGL